MPRAAAALHSRAPSTCSSISFACAHSARAATASGGYTVPSSVLWVIEITRGWTTCSSPIRTRSGATSSGVSRPSGVSTTISLRPARSGAPHSSTFRCAVRAHTTPSHGRVRAETHSTLAPVPLNTGNACAVGPKCSRKRSCMRAVHGSAP